MSDTILSLLFSQAEATQTFWNFYIVVALGILGFLVTTKVDVLSRVVVRVALLLLFGLFAFSNYTGLEKNRVRRAVLFDFAYSSQVPENSMMKSTDEGKGNVRDWCEKQLKVYEVGGDTNHLEYKVLCAALPQTREGLFRFHLLLDILIGMAIVFVPKLREQKK